LVCPWAAGGGTDAVSRFWADALQQELGQPFVVVNKTGGAGVVGHEFGARARPDGYTLTMITFELCTMHQMGLTKLTHSSLEPLYQVNADPAAIVVRNDAKWQTLREFLDDARQRPGKLMMSGTDRGGAWDLARSGLLLADGQAVENIRWIPSNGSAPSLVELLGGHVDAVCCSVPEAAASLDKLRVLTVMSDQRLKDYPEIPTTAEQGIEWTMVGFRGLAFPRDTPAEIREKLLAACEKISHSPEYADFMSRAGYRIEVRNAADFREFLEREDQKWAAVIQATGLGGSQG
jgi:tripartite-type tricarboxylate transporter receptor subunit TctC